MDLSEASKGFPFTNISLHAVSISPSLFIFRVRVMAGRNRDRNPRLKAHLQVVAAVGFLGEALCIHLRDRGVPAPAQRFTVELHEWGHQIFPWKV